VRRLTAVLLATGSLGLIAVGVVSARLNGALIRLGERLLR
jgi:hypothetical protein